MTALSAPPTQRAGTLAELLERLGNVPPERIRLDPPLGTANEADVLRIEARENRLCELVDGTLVDKAIGFRDSVICRASGANSWRICRDTSTGDCGPPGRDAPAVFRPRPDSRHRVPFMGAHPDRKLPRDPIPSLVPDLAVEVLSASNTRAETDRKLREYFEAGVRLVWLIDSEKKRVSVHYAGQPRSILGESDAIDGRDVLPGFSMELRAFFARLPLQD